MLVPSDTLPRLQRCKLRVGVKNRTFRYFKNVTCLNSKDNLFPSISLKVQTQKFPVRACKATCSDINYRTRRSARSERRKANSVLFLLVTQQGPTFQILGQHHVIPNLDLLNQTPGRWVSNRKPGTDQLFQSPLFMEHLTGNRAETNNGIKLSAMRPL